MEKSIRMKIKKQDGIIKVNRKNRIKINKMAFKWIEIGRKGFNCKEKRKKILGNRKRTYFERMEKDTFFRRGMGREIKNMYNGLEKDRK